MGTSTRTSSGTHYVIRGGVDGRERLRTIGRVLRPTTTALFDRVRIEAGWHCLDAGCGGGDVTLELAKRVGPQGSVAGIDIDATKIELARAEAAAQGVNNVRYRQQDIRTQDLDATYGAVYSRFLLMHLPDPAAAVSSFYRHLYPGGRVIVEDIDHRGAFTWPESQAFLAYDDLFVRLVRGRGGDPHIGPRLPRLLADAGFVDVDLNIVQPAALVGELKRLHAMTLENIVDAAVGDGVATRDAIEAMTQELYAFADDPHTIVALPRIVQVWGRRPA